MAVQTLNDETFAKFFCEHRRPPYLDKRRATVPRLRRCLERLYAFAGSFRDRFGPADGPVLPYPADEETLLRLSLHDLGEVAALVDKFREDVDMFVRSAEAESLGYAGLAAVLLRNAGVILASGRNDYETARAFAALTGCPHGHDAAGIATAMAAALQQLRQEQGGGGA